MAQDLLTELGINPYASNRAGSGWTASSISPPELPTPPGFLTPEQVVEQTKNYAPTVKTFTAQDFMTQPALLNDPKLASRPFTSAPNQTALNVPVSVSAYQGVNMPAFLTNAVNQLNQTQSLQSSMQSEYRQKLLNAVLGGNYLAAEALRAASVSPGAHVGFAAAVQSPQFGQAAALSAQTQAKQSEAITQSLKQPVNRQIQLQTQLSQVERQLSNVAPGFASGPERARLNSQQFAIQSELDKLLSAPKLPSYYGSSSYVR